MVDLKLNKDVGVNITTNRKNKIDGLLLLSAIPDDSIKSAFFDPQYRGVLDKLSYGNEGINRGKARSELPQMDENTIIKFIRVSIVILFGISISFLLFLHLLYHTCQ